MNGAPPSYRLDWAPGSNAVLELSVPDPAAGTVMIRFTPPLRGTLRLPVGPLGLTPDALQPVDDQVQALFSSTPGPPRHGGVPQPAVAGPPATLDELCEQLCTITVPPVVGLELQGPGLFLELGTDEALLDYPWELMHDGAEFYCLKHHIGRFVYVTEGVAGRARQVAAVSPLGPFAPLRALVVCVDKPPPVDGVEFPILPNAHQEMVAVADTLTTLGVEVQILGGGGGTHIAVGTALGKGKHQIVHFIGHTYVDPANPGRSGLVLQDQVMPASNVLAFLTKTTWPVLFFVNGCESSRALTDEVSFGRFGLARAILESGAYLIGTRWKVSDGPASWFAQSFYRKLLAEEKPIGQAVTEARHTCRTKFPDDRAWASYTFYGDPRIFFRKS